MAREQAVLTVTERDEPLEAPWHKRISWGAVFAGVVIAIAIMIVLNLLGLAIGLATIDPATGETPGARPLSIGAGIWWIVSALIALYAGGWIASRLAGAFRNETGTIHGLLVWATATLAMVWMASSALGALVGGTFSALGTGAEVAGRAGAAGAQAVAQAMPGEGSLQGVRSELQRILGGGGQDATAREATAPTQPTQQPTPPPTQPTPPQDPQASQADRELANAIESIVRRGDDEFDVQTQDVARQLALRTGMTQQEAERTIERWKDSSRRAAAEARQKTEELKEDAVEAGEKTAQSLSTASFWAFAALLLGAISAGAGGRNATPKVLTTDRDDLAR
jgi:hypothetical protein